MEQIKIAIIGLGYVGLPLARLFATKYSVVGFDVNEKRISELKSGVDKTLEVDEKTLQDVLVERNSIGNGLLCSSSISDLKDCNYFVITVPTPVDKNNRPVLTPLVKASETVGSVLKEGDIVVYESTVYPGATEEDCVPILEKHEILDISVKDLKVDLKGDNGLLMRDNHIIDMSANFYLRISPEMRDIQMVVMALGTEKASSLQELEKMFVPKFSEALRIAGARYSFEDLKHNLEAYKMEVLQTIGIDMNGFALDDISINYMSTSVRKLEIK